MGCGSCGGGRAGYTTPGHIGGGASCGCAAAPCRPGRMLTAEDLGPPEAGRMLTAEDLDSPQASATPPSPASPDAPAAPRPLPPVAATSVPDYGGAPVAPIGLMPGATAPAAEQAPSPMALMGALGRGERADDRGWGPYGESERPDDPWIRQVVYRAERQAAICAMRSQQEEAGELLRFARQVATWLRYDAGELSARDRARAEAAWAAWLSGAIDEAAERCGARASEARRPPIVGPKFRRAVLGGARDQRALGATREVTGDQVCNAMFGPGGKFENFGLLQICRLNLSGREPGDLCGGFTGDLEDYRDDCEAAVNLLAAESFEALLPGRPREADAWRNAEPDDVAALTQILPYTVEIARALRPDKVRECEEDARRNAREGLPSAAYPLYTVGDARSGVPAPVYYWGSLPSGYRLFFANSGGGADPAELAQATGVAPVPGDYIATLQCHGWYYGRHPNGYAAAYTYRFIERRGEGRGVGIDRVQVGHPDLILVTPGAPLPADWRPAGPGYGDWAGGGRPAAKRGGGGLLVPALVVAGAVAVLSAS